MDILVLDPRKSGKQKVYLYPRDYVSVKEEKKLREGALNVADMLDLIRVLKAETAPKQDTTDPKAVEDCWVELESKIAELGR